MTRTSLLISLLFLVYACHDKTYQNQNNNTPQIEGIGYAETNKAASFVYNTIITTLEANSNIGIVAEVDHAANAQNVGLHLDFTKTVYFGNPNLGTPIMQNNIKAGLDLPQRITVYTDEDGDTVVAYNSVDYIVNRHDIGDVATTDMIKNALSNLVKAATGKEALLNTATVSQVAGIISVSSNNDFNTTYNNILNTLNALEPITVMAELNHQANAESVNMELMPAKLIIFGNPALGTPLMEESRTTALDLPQKILVYQESNSEVKIIYNDPYYMAERHGIKNNNETLEKISQALQNIAASGASEN